MGFGGKTEFMNKLLLQLLTLLLFLSSCSNEDGQIDYIPFQTSDGGKWGLISTEGDILFESEFKNLPSVSIDGYFTVKNKNELYEIYSSTKKPEQIGTQYKSVALFSEGLAPVVEPNKWITYINKKGEIEFELKEINGKPVEEAGRFHKGLALVFYDDKYVYINKKGQLALDKSFTYATPFTENGLAFVVDCKNTEKWSIINTSGEVLYNCSKDKCTPAAFIDDKLIVSDANDRNLYWIIDKKGNKIGNTFSAELISDVTKNGFAFKDDNGWGIRDLENVIIRPKYDNISYNGKLIAVKGDEDWHLLNNDGEKKGNGSYKKIECPQNTKGASSYCIVRDGSKYYFAKSNGEIAKDAVAMNNFVCTNLYESVESDYFDVDSLISTLEITAEGVLKMKVGGIFCTEALKAFPSLEPNDFYDIWEKKYSSTVNKCGIPVLCFILMNALPVFDFMGPSECFWNEGSQIIGIGIRIDLTGKLSNKKNLLINSIKKRLSKIAKKTSDLYYKSSKVNFEIMVEDDFIGVIAETK